MPFFIESQREDGDPVANFSFDVTGGSGKSEYLVQSIDAVNLQETITSILGYTETAVNRGPTLNRNPPRRHPKFPYLYASRVSMLQGTGFKDSSLVDASAAPLTALDATPMTSQFRSYGTVKLGVEFTGPRTYPVVQNGIIESTSGSWYRPDGTQQSYSWAPEYLRYTDFDITPQDNQLQGQQGSMTLFKGAQAIPFTSPPWLYLPDYLLKITFYQIPYRFVISPKSYISAAPWRGRVNQNYLWFWPPGWLLYLTYNVRKYAPPTGLAQTLQNSSGLYTYFNYAQLCDVDLLFLVTNRRASSSLGFSPTNKNYVTGIQADGISPGAGHNMLPDMTTGKYYYATRNDSTGASSTNNPPAWLSAPLECLFSDPDCGGGPDLV